MYKLARRSIVAKTDIPAGTVVTREMITLKRPGTGIPPKMLDVVIGRTVKKNIIKNQAITWEHI